MRCGRNRAISRSAPGSGGGVAPPMCLAKAYHALAIVVLATTRTHLSRITLFGDPGLFGRFGLSLVQPGRRS